MRPLFIWVHSAKRYSRRSEWGLWFSPALAKAARPAIGSLLRGGHRAEQRTLALFIEEGHYARHLAAMRRLYRKRYRQLREALNAELHVPHRILAGKGHASDGGD